MKFVKVTLFALLAALVAVGMSTNRVFLPLGRRRRVRGVPQHALSCKRYFLLVGGDQSSTCLTCHEGPTPVELSRQHNRGR